MKYLLLTLLLLAGCAKPDSQPTRGVRTVDSYWISEYNAQEWDLRGLSLDLESKPRQLPKWPNPVKIEISGDMFTGTIFFTDPGLNRHQGTYKVYGDKLELCIFNLSVLECDMLR